MGDNPYRVSIEKITAKLLEFVGVEYGPAPDVQDAPETILKQMAELQAKLAAMMQNEKKSA
jgi:hypothetical protein